MQIFEVSINYINNRVIERLKTLKTLHEKEDLFFDILKRYNAKYKHSAFEYYRSLSKPKKEEYFESVIRDGIYIHIPPMWREKKLFDIVNDIYKDYPWIGFKQVYVNRYGRKIPLLNDVIIGEQYMIKLKQSSKKGFSARSAGALSKRGVPEKSFKNKAHQELHSTTPIRQGEQENMNSLIGVSPETVVELHTAYRSSPIARRDLGCKLLESTKPLKDFKSKLTYVNRNVEIMQALLKSMGYKIGYFGKDYKINIETGALKSKMVGEKFVIGTDSDIDDCEKRHEIIKKYSDDICFIGTVGEYEELIEKEFERSKLDDEYYVIDIE